MFDKQARSYQDVIMDFMITSEADMSLLQSFQNIPINKC